MDGKTVRPGIKCLFVNRYRIVPVEKGKDRLRISGSWVAAIDVASAYEAFVRYAEWSDADQMLVLLTSEYELVFERRAIFEGFHGDNNDWLASLPQGRFTKDELFGFVDGALTQQQMDREAWLARVPKRRTPLLERLENKLSVRSPSSDRTRWAVVRILLSLIGAVAIVVYWIQFLSLITWGCVAAVMFFILRAAFMRY